MRPREEGTVPHAGELAGIKTRELAGWIKSWNPYEAALGLAAINSALNAPDVVERSCGPLLDRTGKENVFAYLLEELRGKRVAVIGHFRDLECIGAVCDLTILERYPEPGDLPDMACEYTETSNQCQQFDTQMNPRLRSPCVRYVCTTAGRNFLSLKPGEWMREGRAGSHSRLPRQICSAR